LDARRGELERRYEGLTSNEKLKLLKQDVNEAAKESRVLQTSHRRQEQRQQPFGQLDYIFDFDCPTAESLPRVIFPFEGDSMQFLGDFVLKFWILKKGEKKEICNVGISRKAHSPFH